MLLDRSGQGKVYNLINRRRFQQMDVLEGLNVLVTISGMLLSWPDPQGCIMVSEEALASKPHEMCQAVAGEITHAFCNAGGAGPTGSLPVCWTRGRQTRPQKLCVLAFAALTTQQDSYWAVCPAVPVIPIAKWRVLGGELLSRSLSFLKMSSYNPLIIWGWLYYWVANSREKIVGTCSLVHFYDINSFLKWKDPVRQVSLITNKWKVQLESMIVDKVFHSSWWWLKDLN